VAGGRGEKRGEDCSHEGNGGARRGEKNMFGRVPFHLVSIYGKEFGTKKGVRFGTEEKMHWIRLFVRQRGEQ